MERQSIYDTMRAEQPSDPCDLIPFTFDLTTSGICAHYSSVVIHTPHTGMQAHDTHIRTQSLTHAHFKGSRAIFDFMALKYI